VRNDLPKDVRFLLRRWIATTHPPPSETFWPEVRALSRDHQRLFLGEMQAENERAVAEMDGAIAGFERDLVVLRQQVDHTKDLRAQRVADGAKLAGMLAALDAGAAESPASP
jgi:hypothetical protein